MNEMEKKIKEQAQTRQAQMSQKEKEELVVTTENMKKEAQAAKEQVLKDGGVGRTSKSSKDRAAGKQTTPNAGKTPPKTGQKPPVSKEKAPTQKTPKADPKPQPKVKVPAGVLTTKEVAAMVGTTPKALRRVLRAKWYNDGVTTNYRWTKDDPILKEIVQHYASAPATNSK